MEVRTAEINRDRDLREREVEALLAAETIKIDSQIALAKKRAAELAAQADTELARKKVIAAQEEVQAEKERLAAERELDTALIRVRQESQTSEERAKSEVKTLLDRVRAETNAADMRSDARRSELKAEADGRQAIVAAENSMSDSVMRMKIDMHKIDKLPELAERMMKPVEKIDSIRINQIQGLGQMGGGDGRRGLARPECNRRDPQPRLAIADHAEARPVARPQSRSRRGRPCGEGSTG